MHIRIKMAMGSIICGASTPKMKRKKAKVSHVFIYSTLFKKRYFSQTSHFTLPFNTVNTTYFVNRYMCISFCNDK